MGDIPEQIVARFGGYVSLAQVHAALAYYFANKAEVDADLEDEERLGDELANQYPALRRIVVLCSAKTAADMRNHIEFLGNWR